ncbi:MAG: winged helix-turn-helix domain-containing protein, partial [Selenomonadaceae bacterium]
MDNLKEATLQSELRFKDLVINPCHRSVLINNNRIDLTTKEFDLLYFLAIHPGWAFTKSQIYETVWGEEYVCKFKGKTCIGSTVFQESATADNVVYVRRINFEVANSSYVWRSFLNRRTVFTHITVRFKFTCNRSVYTDSAVGFNAPYNRSP